MHRVLRQDPRFAGRLRDFPLRGHAAARDRDRAEFSVIFPFARSMNDSARVPGSHSRADANMPQEIRRPSRKGIAMKVKALVVDDSGIMRKMVMKTVTEAKFGEFEFVEAEDGQVALEKMKAIDFDIAFVDWNMPNMTGVDFVREVRKVEKGSGNEAIPMVMVTSEKTMGKIQEALDEAGADGFISKPFTVEELQVKLKKHVEKAQLLRVRKNRLTAPPAQTEAASGGWFGKIFS
jgi:two-component system chemotaxis response regulator CheY